MPIVTTLHTVLLQPTPVQRDVVRRIIDTSTKIVMSEKGREFLGSVHEAPARKIEVIPHGIRDLPFLESHHAKAGVESALENLRAEIERDMKLMGCRFVDQLSRDNLRFR
jgi:hypothetical protein